MQSLLPIFFSSADALLKITQERLLEEELTHSELAILNSLVELTVVLSAV